MSREIKEIIEEAEGERPYMLKYYRELKEIKSSVISKKDYDDYKSYELHNIYEHIPTNKFYKFKIWYSSWEGSEIVKFLGEVELKQKIITEWIVKDKEENV